MATTPLQQAKADLASIDRVSHRLALTESDKLPSVIDKLLPRLLVRIKSNQEKLLLQSSDEATPILQSIHDKLVEMLSHTMKRVRADRECQLPCLELLNVLLTTLDADGEATTTPFLLTMNLSLAFLSIGVPRSTERVNLLPSLLKLLPHSYTFPAIAHLLLCCLESTAAAAEPVEEIHHLLQQNDTIAAALYDLLLDVLLFTPMTSSNLPCDGLSQRGMERLTSNKANVMYETLMIPAKRTLFQCQLLDSWIAPTKRQAFFQNDERSVLLLVVATTNANGDVAQLAGRHLKSLDGTTKQSSQRRQVDSWKLAGAALSLCLGQSVAEQVADYSLGQRLSSSSLATIQETFATKRRAIANATSIVSFVSKLFLEEKALQEEENGASASTLAMQLCHRTLSSSVASSGLSTQRAKPLIAAAQLLNSVTIRLTLMEMTVPIESLLAKALALACLVLTPASQPNMGSSGNRANASSSEGNLAVRDACYGVVSTVSRCHSFVTLTKGYVFALGEAQQVGDDDDKLIASTKTAKLLFGCSANEEEKLRPRAVAALDALLGAYRRVYSTKDEEMSERVERMDVDETEVSSNPWLSLDSTRVDTGVDGIQVDRAALAKSLLPMIWSAAQPYRPKASRVAAARWSKDLLVELDLSSACHLLCFLSGDSDTTAASIAREGLGLSDVSLDVHVVILDDAPRLPTFAEIVNLVFVSNDPPSGQLQRFQEFSPSGKASTLRFALMSLLHDLYGGDDDAIGLYLGTICEVLHGFLGSPSSSGGRTVVDLLDECAACLLSTLSASKFARQQISAGRAALSISDMESLAIEASSSRARRQLAGACGKLYEDIHLWTAEDEPSFEIWTQTSGVYRALCSSRKHLSGLASFISVPGIVHGSAFLGSHAVRAFRLAALRCSNTAENAEGWSDLDAVLVSLSQGLLNADEVIGNACCDGLSIALSYEGVDAPILDAKMYNSCALVLSNLTAALNRFGNGDQTDPLRALKLAKAAGITLAATTSGSGVVQTSKSGEIVQLGPARQACVESLFNLLGSMSNRKEDEISLTAGEALAAYADAFSPENAVWSSSVAEWPADYSAGFAGALPPHQHVLYVLLGKILPASSPHIRTACAPALLAIVARVAKGLNSDMNYSKRAIVQEILCRLGAIQNVFIQLLSDAKSKQFVRESCCLGFAACRGIAAAGDALISGQLTSEDLNGKLLRAFGQTTVFASSVYIETQAQAEQRRAAERAGTNQPSMEALGAENEDVGGASGISESALGAYREMAAASVSLGRHDILYALLILSVSHPCWFTSEKSEIYSSASLLGESLGKQANTLEMRNSLKPHLGKLLPRILRARHDPNKQTRDQMKSLWEGLTGGGAEARLLVSQHLLPTIDALVEDASSKFWRARVGACGALSEIIVGRDWNELGGGDAVLSDDFDEVSSAGSRLLRLWRASMRSMDDIRGAVRDRGETLARSVRALTVRLCDPTPTDESSNGSGMKRPRKDFLETEKNACAAAATSLRWLIKHGLSQPCAEATGICVSTLVDVVSTVRPTILRPVLPDLIRSLLMAISGLEPAALNFLQLRTSDQDGMERIRIQLASSGPLAAAVNTCLDMLPKVNIETQQAVVPQLDTALRMAAGFASRAAVADFVSSMCTTCPDAFRFSGSSTSNPSVRLLRALYFASERERGQAAKDRMIHALGGLAGLCPGSSVRSLATRACSRYNTSTGSNDDPVTRKSAAATIRALAVRASHHFSEGTSEDFWRERVLPVAYLGRKDPDAKIASLWKEVWEEGEGSTKGNESFGTRLEETLLPFLVKECATALKDVSWARRIAGANALSDLSHLGILAPAPRSLNTSEVARRVSGRARYRADASNFALRECLQVLVKPRLWTGKSEVLKAAVDIACQWSAAETGSDNNQLLLYGWDGPGECPWKPVTVCLDNESDLFVGDCFFMSSVGGESETDTDEAPQSSSPMDVDARENEEETKISFDDCENELNEEKKSSDIVDVDEVKSPLSFVGFCRILLQQALRKSRTTSDEVLPYRLAAFKGITSLLRSLPVDSTICKQQVYALVAPDLKMVIASVDDNDGEPPVLVAGALSSLTACFWDGIGSSSNEAHVEKLLETLKVLNRHTAWTVREESLLCIAQLVATCDAEKLRRYQTVSTVVECAREGQSDRKFWKVRYSGVKVVQNLVGRVGPSGASLSEEKQLILEAILPHKEDILRLLRSSLRDSEAQVTALSSDVLSGMALWP